MKGQTSTVRIDDLLYTIEHWQASAHPLSTGEWFFPRNTVSHAGFSIRVVSLSHLPGYSTPRSPARFACIPSSVTSFYDLFFMGCLKLAILAFEPNSQVFSFIRSLFSYCISLRSISIPSSVTTISFACFDNCHALSSVTFESGSRVSGFHETAFGGCRSLQSICIPSSVESLSQFCFADCSLLCFVQFEPGSRLSSLEEYLFKGCSSLRSMSLPAGVCKLTSLTFEGLMTNILKFDPENSVFGIHGDFVVNFEENSLVRYLETDGEVVIEKEFAGIGAFCFRNAYGVLKIRFEACSQISFFGIGAFWACTHLASFSIPSTLETIPAQCFQDCYDLAEVTFEPVSRVSVLAEQAFAYCSSLTAICIPWSVTRIGRECFFECRSLAAATAEDGSQLSAVDPLAFSGCAPSLHFSPVFSQWFAC
jgi:hypothetical protein